MSDKQVLTIELARRTFIQAKTKLYDKKRKNHILPLAACVATYFLICYDAWRGCLCAQYVGVKRNFYSALCV